MSETPDRKRRRPWPHPLHFSPVPPVVAALAAVLAVVVPAAAQAPPSSAPSSASSPSSATSPAPASSPAPSTAPSGSPAPADAPPLLQHHEELVVKDTAEAVPADTTIVKIPAAVLLLPLSVDVIGAPLLAEQDAHILGDALRDASGVGIHTESGAADFFVVRGFDSETSSLVMTDGAPEPVTSFYQLYNADRVEVLKGPASFLYGGDPLAGAVNIVRKQPVSGDFVNLTGEGGSFGTRQGTIDTNWSSPDDQFGLRLNGLWDATDGWRDGRDGRVGAFNPTFAWRSGVSSVVVSVERMEDSYSPDAGLPLLGNRVADVPASRSYQSPFDRSDQLLDRFQIDWETKVGDFTLHDKAYYRELSWTSDGTLLDGVFPDATGALQVARSLVLLDDRQAFYGNQLEGSVNVATGPVTHQLLAGVELSRRDDTYSLGVGLLPSISLLAPVETAQGPVQLLPGESSAGDTRMSILAPYVLDRLVFSDQFQLMVGGRYDHLDYHDPLNATTRDDSQFSPMGGVTWSPVKAWSLYADAGRGFAPPSSRVIGPALPETGTQEEVGVKGNFLDGRVRTNVALYNLERRNEAIPDANGFTEQTGSQRSRGVEAEVTIQRLMGWEMLLNYAYDRAVFTHFAESVQVSEEPPAFEVFDRSGNTPPLAPAQIVNLWLSRKLPHGIGLGVGGRYVSSQFIAADNAYAIPAVFTADAMLTVPVGPFEGRLQLRNLTDAKYYTRGLGTTSVIPAAPIAIFAGFALRWNGPAAAHQPGK
jgi:iron complex outermembrane receptor protein